jgi:hypothetical protein
MVLPALTLIATALLAPPQAITYEQINKSSPTETLAFDWDGLDVNGQPISLARAEFLFRVHPAPSPLPPPIVLPTAAAPSIGANAYLVRNVAKDVPLGKYALTVRAVSATGIAGDEGNILYVEVIDSKKPGVLRNLRKGATP